MAAFANDDGQEGYVPSEDEQFMCERQLAWFRSRLIAWREDILQTSGHVLDELRSTSMRDPDMSDRASSESDWATELRTRDRQRKLLSKIAGALSRIDMGEYGYCEVTGDEIPLARLVARPTASMTVEAQAAHERMERVSRAA